MSSTPTISIVLPNWNGKHLMAKHLPYVLAENGVAEIIVSDDASSDGSVAFLKKNFPRVKVIERKIREGFASNVNTGVAAASGDIVVLLNTDVRPQKGFLAPLLAHFSDPTVFAVGCLEKSHEGDKIILRGRGEAMWKKGFFVHSRGEVDKKTTAWVSGGSGAFRKTYWDRLGGMDVMCNPFYWEDIDLSYRGLTSGYRLVFEPKSIVHHYHESGKIIQSFTPNEVKIIAFRNQFTFIWKNLTDVRLMLEHMLWLPIRLAQAVVRRDFIMLAGFGKAVARLGLIIIARKKCAKVKVLSDSEVSLS